MLSVILVKFVIGNLFLLPPVRHDVVDCHIEAVCLFIGFGPKAQSGFQGFSSVRSCHTSSYGTCSPKIFCCAPRVGPAGSYLRHAQAKKCQHPLLDFFVRALEVAANKIK